MNFILVAQNKQDGGWRYNPGDPGDTSVTGWQLLALQSGRRAGLDVGEKCFSAASKWLDAVAVRDGQEYAYQPGEDPCDTMSAAGLVGRKILGAQRDDPMLVGGAKYLLGHLPDETRPNLYYAYYATQVMHYLGGSDWETWKRTVREQLIRTQVRNADECANGSLDPRHDPWGKHGGRVMQTSLAALTLETDYHWLPIYGRANK